MRYLGLDLVIQVVTVICYSGIAVTLAIAGLLLEYRSYLYLSAGETELALWIAAIGALVLIAGALVVRDKLLANIVEF